MPMHEQRHTASFHILHGQIEGFFFFLLYKKIHFLNRISKFNIRRWLSNNIK